MKRITIITTICLLIAAHFSQPSNGLAVTRSSGLGFRFSFWNVTNQPTKIGVTGLGEEVTIHINGAGASVYFFSRIQANWYFELSLDAIGTVEGTSSKFSDNDFNVSALVPLLFGLRYDLLSTRFSSAFQPYLSLGAGPYWGSSIQLSGDNFNAEQSLNSGIDYGGYLGGGTNVMLWSWLALNFDFKYHFVDFRTTNKYSGLQFGIGFNLMWGRKREIFRVKGTKILVPNIYPTFYQFYKTYPLALVTVQNTAGYPIEVNVRCHINGFSEKPKDSGFIRIGRGKTADIPVTAFFRSSFREINRREAAIMNLEVEARTGGIHRKTFSAQITIHHRNAWDGDVEKLKFFVTPGDEHVLQFTRQQIEINQKTDAKAVQSLNSAQMIFEKLRRLGLKYRTDPNIPFYQDDRVQFAAETLKMKGGDCDDLVVLYASLLESVGIHTAFVEVQDPQKTMAHLYLLFDSGLSFEQGNQISANEKKYIFRKETNTIWIPVETTLIKDGFEKAWNSAALAWLQEGILRAGLADGWVKIVDVK